MRARARALLSDRRIRLPLNVAAAVGAYFLVKGLLPEVDLQDLLDDLARALGDWTYLLVGVFALLETGAFVGLILPGETVVILAGAVAGVGETSLELTIGIVWFCAWAGDSVSFLLGCRLGRDFVLRHGPQVRITPERFAGVERYFGRHGGKTILIGRFIGFVRALAPFIAGSSGMRYRAFVPFSILGTGLWAAAFTAVGYLASRSLDQAAKVAGQGTFLFGIAVAVVVGIVLAVRYLKDAGNRARIVAALERRPLLRPLLALGRRLRPQAAFLWHRVTPGQLGLELTTLLAALSVGLFVLAAYATTIDADPGPTGADEAALDFVTGIASGWQTSANEAITTLGAAYVALPVAALGALGLAIRRHPAEAAVVLVATLLIAVAVPEIKDALDRPRPPDPLAGAAGSVSFASGHAAYSTIYVALAVLFARELNPRLTLRGVAVGTLIVLAGIVLAALIGLSRVYLRVHYLSDVLGGWGLGVAAFALCGATAIVVTHLRQNERRAGGPDFEGRA